jgi:hypothetical protein
MQLRKDRKRRFIMAIVSVPARAAIHQAVAAFEASNALHPNGETVFLALADVPASETASYE